MPSERYITKVKQRNLDRLNWVREQLSQATDAIDLDFRGEIAVTIPVLGGLYGDPAFTVKKFRPKDDNPPPQE